MLKQIIKSRWFLLVINTRRIDDSECACARARHRRRPSRASSLWPESHLGRFVVRHCLTPNRPFSGICLNNVYFPEMATCRPTGQANEINHSTLQNGRFFSAESRLELLPAKAAIHQTGNGVNAISA